MSISQISGSNTFSHWLGATQQLITKYNAFETNLDSIANTANNVLVIKNDTQNIYSNTVNVYNAANNVYQDIIDYTSTAYDTANNAKDLANTAINNAQDAYDLSVAAYAEASNAYSTSEIAAATAENANTVATDILNNIGDYANTAANNVIYPIFDIDNVNSDNDTYYPTLTESPEYLSKVVVSTARMSFIPATGTLTANTFNATTDIKFNGSVIANSSGWVGNTIPISKGGTGATSATDARSNLELVIGTNVQAYSSKLTDIAALTASSNNVIIGNGTTWTSKTPAESRTALGLNLGTDAYKLVQTVSGGGLISVNRGTDGYYLKQTSTGFIWDAGPGSLTASSPLSITGGNISLNQNFAGSSSMGGAATSVANALTFSNAGSGNTDSYNGSVGKTISYNSVGAPKVDGTGASGTWGISITGNAATATTAGSCSGNAATATNLLAARNINGTSFNGSANITTANWGTSRTITIGQTGKSVNGSAGVSWSLSDIGAAASSHSHDNYITNSGDSNHTDGTLEFRSNNDYQPQLLLKNFSANTSGPYLIMGSARGTRTAPSATLNGDNLGVVFYAGYINSTYPQVNGAVINCKVTGPATSNKFPAALEFETVNDSGVIGTRMTIGSDMLVQMHTGIKTAFSRSGFGQIDGTFQVTDFIGSQASPGGTGIYFKNNSSNVAGMLYAAQAACGLVSDNGLNYGAPSHTWFINKVQEMFLDSGYLRPYTNNGLALGASDLRWNIAYITNGVTTGSDARSKKDIVESNLGLDFILRLNPVSYKWKEDSSKAPAELVGRTNFGFIAQEVEESLEGQDFGGLMYDSQTDIYGLRYEQFIAPLTKAIQEQQEIIKSLQLRIETLEKSANVSL